MRTGERGGPTLLGIRRQSVFGGLAGYKVDLPPTSIYANLKTVKSIVDWISTKSISGAIWRSL